MPVPREHIFCLQMHLSLITYGFLHKESLSFTRLLLGNWELLSSEAKGVGSGTEVERVLWKMSQIRFEFNSTVKPQNTQIYEEAGAICKVRRFPAAHPKLALHRQEPVALLRLGEGGGDVRGVTSKREANSWLPFGICLGSFSVLS